MLLHHVEQARAKEDFSAVSQVGVDETSHRRGHDYVSVFVDLDRSKAIFATPTREKKVVAEFKEDLLAHGGEADKVVNFSADLWQPYRDGEEHDQRPRVAGSEAPAWARNGCASNSTPYLHPTAPA